MYHFGLLLMWVRGPVNRKESIMEVTVQTGCSYVTFQAQSIHLREKNIVGPTERSKSVSFFTARREGPAFFDEDDVCAGF